MSYYGGYDGTFVIKNYGKSYRDLRFRVGTGIVKVVCADGTKLKVNVVDNEITEQRTWKEGRLKYAIKYGEYEKSLEDGKVYDIRRYKKGTARGKHGLAIRRGLRLEGYEGNCYTFYSRGTAIWQKFTYNNGKVAYYVRRKHAECKAVHPDGKPLFHIKVSRFGLKGNSECIPFIYCVDERQYSEDGIYCEYTFYDKRGRIKEYGKYENRQKVGEWVDKYKRYFYMSGVPIDKAMYNKKPENIKASEVLRIDNSQARAMMLKKVGYDRVVRECKGKVIDKDGNYELIDFPIKPDKLRDREWGQDNRADGQDNRADKVLRILKVVCLIFV